MSKTKFKESNKVNKKIIKCGDTTFKCKDRIGNTCNSKDECSLKM